MSKIETCITSGALLAVITSLFGDWNEAMTSLVILMAIDYITGLMVASIFKKSKKTNNGGLSSNTAFKGICKKAVILLVIVAGYRMDIVTRSYMDLGIFEKGFLIKNCLCGGFIASEFISLIENAYLMDLPIPEKIINALDIKRGDTSAE